MRCNTILGVFLAFAVMKQLLLLAFVAVASEAMAQDAQCVPEGAAMVETIRAYARLEADVLGPQAGNARERAVDRAHPAEGAQIGREGGETP
jgi:hypothetical protein